MAMVLAVAVAPPVGPRLRPKGCLNPFHRQAPLAQQIGQHRILQDPQFTRVQFHRHMAVAQVVGRLQQGQGVGAAHLQQRFRRRFHPHQPISRSRGEQLAGLERRAAGQLQHQVPATGADPVAAQAGALVGREQQPQGLPPTALFAAPLARSQPVNQDQGRQGVCHGPSLQGRGSFAGHGAGKMCGLQRAAAAAAVKVRRHPPPMSDSWQAEARLQFSLQGSGEKALPRTTFQGGATAPLKIQRAFQQADGRCELPLLHTAGGLVGGDRIKVSAALEPGSRVLLTSVAAQKVYGTVGRSRQAPQGRWVQQELLFQLAAGADLEWLPQELVLFADGLFEQTCRVELAPGASWLGAEVVRLGRSAAGEGLGQGRWRSQLEIRRLQGPASRWELVDRLELGGASLDGDHGLAGQPVFGSLVWVAPDPLAAAELEALASLCRDDRAGLEGEMACGPLDQGLVARYRGPSSQAARYWFTRIWARLRQQRHQPAPQLPRVWPFQESPWIGAEP